MKLSLDPRPMLVARMQAYAHCYVMQGKLHIAEGLADAALEALTLAMEMNPIDSETFWAGVYYKQFEANCYSAGITILK